MKYWIGAFALACATSSWAAPDWTRATILSISPQKAKVTLDAERVASFGMDAMAMEYTVAKDVKLDKFKPGDKVRFTVINKGGNLVVDAIESAK
jgi:Cu(I)/Ag(I) efflux system protein CusF